MTVEPQDLGWCLYYDKSSSSFWEGFLILVLYLPCQFSLFLPKILCQPPSFFCNQKTPHDSGSHRSLKSLPPRYNGSIVLIFWGPINPNWFRHHLHGRKKSPPWGTKVRQRQGRSPKQKKSLKKCPENLRKHHRYHIWKGFFTFNPRAFLTKLWNTCEGFFWKTYTQIPTYWSHISILWVWPLPRNSDHQDYYIFSRESL